MLRECYGSREGMEDSEWGRNSSPARNRNPMSVSPPNIVCSLYKVRHTKLCTVIGVLYGIISFKMVDWLIFFCITFNKIFNENMYQGWNTSKMAVRTVFLLRIPLTSMYFLQIVCEQTKETEEIPNLILAYPLINTLYCFSFWWWCW
jgi:hypothetical protein